MEVAAHLRSGPVATALEAELRAYVRKNGLIVWLDAHGHYTEFVDRLIAAREADKLPYAVYSFRGSHLELMLELEDVATGADAPHVVVHLPGYSQKTVPDTPVYDLYAAGKRFEKRLDTLITEAAARQVKPEEIAAYVEGADLSLENADAWLAARMQGRGGGLASQLEAMRPEALLDDLLTGGAVAARLVDKAERKVLWDRLTAWTGLTDRWREEAAPADQGAHDFAFALASWALCVEYTADLVRAPINEHLGAIPGLPRQVIDTCLGLAAHLRERHPENYRRIADETEAHLADEVEAARAQDLGKIDTFRFEEDRILKAALEALADNAWDTAAEYATLRLGKRSAQLSFWLKDDPARLSAWQLVSGAAKLGQAIARAGERLGAGASLEAAAEAYAERGAAVDRAHRHLEQRRVALLFPQLPEFESLRARMNEMRRYWRRWADAWARDFNALCRQHGFLPAASHQQRTLFDEVVGPLARESGVTAYFVIDAFRYEMGQELLKELEGARATTVQLRPRLAELPTVTDVGMNVLAPVAHGGKLSPKLSSPEGGELKGFSTGEFHVSSPETRKRAMHDRVGGATCPWLSLEEVVSGEGPSLTRSIAKAKLVVVHSQEIDNAGEKGVGPSVFDHVLKKIKAAWQLLREAGVRRFVFTSDHGFLLTGDSAEHVQSHGRKIDPQRRHIFSPVAADHAGEARVSLAELGYEGVSGHLMLPETTAVFNRGTKSQTFVHGGNSLQERVIPVLTALHRAAAGGSTLQYAIAARGLPDVVGLHRLEVKVDVAAQKALDFGSPAKIPLALKVRDDERVDVELVQAGGSAEITGVVVEATVGESFELLFRLMGPTDARVQVEVYHPSAVENVESRVPDALFAVAPVARPAAPASEPRQPTGGEGPASAEPEPGPGAGGSAWLERLPEGAVRRVFEHLAKYGAVTEQEAIQMLGGARAHRKFSRQFDEHVQRVPFVARIETIGGVKRYVRDGGSE